MTIASQTIIKKKTTLPRAPTLFKEANERATEPTGVISSTVMRIFVEVRSIAKRRHVKEIKFLQKRH
jgi:hypothetical protein